VNRQPVGVIPAAVGRVHADRHASSYISGVAQARAGGEWLRAGCLIQVTRDPLWTILASGKRSTKRVAGAELDHFVATDAHHPIKRPPIKAHILRASDRKETAGVS